MTQFLRRMLLIVVVTSVASPVAAQHWPMFRGPEASGVADGQDLPDRWDAETGENILWKTGIAGLGHSSPVIWGDRIFLTTAVSSSRDSVFQTETTGQIDRRSDESIHTWWVHALDKHSGRILWSRKALEGRPRVHRHPKNSYASATPATNGTHLVVVFGSEGLYCFDVDGNLLWTQDLGVIDAGASYDDTYDWGPAASPIIFDGMAIVLADGHAGSFVAAYDLRTGRQVWRTPRDLISSFSTPNVSAGHQPAELVTNGAGTIIGYDARTGAERWRLRGSSFNTTPTPVFGHGLIFLASGYRARPIHAVRLGAAGDITPAEAGATGAFVAWSSDRDGPYMATPLVYGEYLYLLHTNGALACYRARTGELVYRERVGSGGWFFASPVAADGKLYIAGEAGEIFVLQAGPQFRVLARNPSAELLMATPALSEGRMYVRAHDHLYAVGRPGASGPPRR